MNYPIPVSRRRDRTRATRVAVAVACTGVLSFTGLTPLTGEAAAAPKQIRCDDKYNLRGKNIKPATDFPGDASRIKAKWDSYRFPNQRHAMDGLKLPADVAKQKEFLARYDKPYKEYAEGTPERVYATYKNYMEGKQWNDQKYGSFDNWLNDAYIELEARRTRGDAFEAKVVEDMGLVGPDWLCQEYVEYERDANGKPLYRKYDAVNYKRGIFVEMKSGGDNDGSQTPKDRKLLTSAKYQDFKIRFAFGEAVSDDTTKRIQNMNRRIGPDANGNNRVTGYAHHSTATPEYKPGKWTKPGTLMTPAPGQSPASPGTDNITRSQPTPNDARRQQERANAANRNGSGVKGPGGVDFTTLDLRYVGKPVKGKGLDYSFSAKEITDPAQPGWGGQEKAQLISDSFFTWMALTPEKFWVNLNPDEPDRVMDKQFGKTDAGRVLLQADLEMKHDYARLMDPREGPGKQYQDAMREAGVPCGTVTRNWIVPKTAVVRVDDNGIYILDTPLKVNSEASDVHTPDPNGNDCTLTPAQRRISESLVNRIIIPEVERRVNNAPNYADLRRVYTARVAAEYVRQQDQAAATDFRPIINSNNVTKWPLRGANRTWTPKQTFDAYVKSFTQGDYSFPCEVNGQNKICVMGGVDFSKAPKRNVTRAQFTTEHRHLPRTTKTSTKAMTDDAENEDTLFLGGNTRNTGGGTHPTPSPTPSPSDDPKPTDQPSTPAPTTPAPTTSTPAPRPTGDPAHPGGDLAHTGAGAPTGLITALAALLVAVGGGLLWWRKRRGTGA